MLIIYFIYDKGDKIRTLITNSSFNDYNFLLKQDEQYFHGLVL
jgi:hypothetical protein